MKGESLECHNPNIDTVTPPLTPGYPPHALPPSEAASSGSSWRSSRWPTRALGRRRRCIHPPAPGLSLVSLATSSPGLPLYFEAFVGEPV